MHRVRKHRNVYFYDFLSRPRLQPLPHSRIAKIKSSSFVFDCSQGLVAEIKLEYKINFGCAASATKENDKEDLILASQPQFGWK